VWQPAGRYNELPFGTSADACTMCPEHSMTPNHASTRVADCLCSETFVPSVGANGSLTCVCAPGFEIVNGVRCAACRMNSYKPRQGNHKCLDCPVVDTVTTTVGAVAVAQCACMHGKFARSSSATLGGTFECQPCNSLHETHTLAMTNCTMAGVTLERIPIQPEFWRQSPTSEIVRSCDSQGFCLGGDVPGDASCAKGHRGPLCDVCVQTPLYYGGRGKSCRLCSGAGNVPFTISMALGGCSLALVAGLALTIWCKQHAAKLVTNALIAVETTLDRPAAQTGKKAQQLADRTRKRPARRFNSFRSSARSTGSTRSSSLDKGGRQKAPLSRAVNLLSRLGPKLRILVSLFQVLSQIGTTYDIAFPDLYSESVALLSHVNLNIDFLPFGCVLPSLDNYLFEFVVQTATPAACVLLMMATSAGLRRRYGTQQMRVSSERPTALLVADLIEDVWFFALFLVYPRCSTSTFMFFMTETFDGPGEVALRVMRADRSIEIGSVPHLALTPYALFMLVVYPFGVPVLYAMLLYRSRNELRELRLIEITLETDYKLTKLAAAGAPSVEETEELMGKAEEAHEAGRAQFEKLRMELPTALRKLTAGYELRCFWFEIFECCRKIALVGLPVFFPSGSPGQMILGLIICFLTYGMYGVFAPYDEPSDDLLAQVAQVTIFFSMVASIITNAYPNDPVMSALLPGMLAVPIAMTLVTALAETELLNVYSLPEETRCGRLWRSIGSRIHFVAARRISFVDRMVGAVRPSVARDLLDEKRQSVMKFTVIMAKWTDGFTEPQGAITKSREVETLQGDEADRYTTRLKCKQVRIDTEFERKLDYIDPQLSSEVGGAAGVGISATVGLAQTAIHVEVEVASMTEHGEGEAEMHVGATVRPGQLSVRKVPVDKLHT